MKPSIIPIVLIALATPVPAWATDAHHPGALAANQTSGLTDAEVRKVDKDAKKITLRHGAIQNLGMPPMTMVFQVKDPAVLDQVKAGDQVRFSAEKAAGAYVITHIEAVK